MRQNIYLKLLRRPPFFKIVTIREELSKVSIQNWNEIKLDLDNYFICKTVQGASFEKGTKGKRQLDNTSLVYGIASILKQQYGHYFICYQKKFLEAI